MVITEVSMARMGVIIAVEIWLCPFRPVPHLAVYPISSVSIFGKHSLLLHASRPCL